MVANKCVVVRIEGHGLCQRYYAGRSGTMSPGFVWYVTPAGKIITPYHQRRLGIKPNDYELMGALIASHYSPELIAACPYQKNPLLEMIPTDLIWKPRLLVIPLTYGGGDENS